MWLWGAEGYLEHISTTLTGCTDDLRRVDLNKSFLGQGVPEQLAHTSLKPEDGLVGGSPQVKHSVIKTDVLVDPGKGSFIFFSQLPGSIFYL